MQMEEESENFVPSFCQKIMLPCMKHKAAENQGVMVIGAAIPQTSQKASHRLLKKKKAHVV